MNLKSLILTNRKQTASNTYRRMDAQRARFGSLILICLHSVTLSAKSSQRDRDEF